MESNEKRLWNPRTKLGLMVQSGKITSLSSVFEMGFRIREPEIVKTLLPDIKTEVISAGIVQKQTDAGEVTRFVAIVAVGTTGWFGVGRGKAMQMRSAIDKATNSALLNILPVKLGCGSWECRCARPHSVPYKIVGKAGSVTVEV
ncbi:MAG: 30S ribosomal protein S5, partial [Nitrososphaerales archaeon]